MKTCTGCNNSKNLEEFAKDKRGKQGRTSRCKECRKKYAKKYREENPEKAKSSCRNSYRKYKDKRKEYVKKYYEENREYICERERAYYYRNRGRYSLYFKQYRRENPDKFRVYSGVRRARKAGLPDTLTVDEQNSLIGLFNNTCAICESPYEHLDHFIPICTGHGGTCIENIVPMCAKCNQSKGAKNPFEWAKSLPKEQRERFNNLVKYLTDLNGIAVVKDYETHVYQCFN